MGCGIAAALSLAGHTVRVVEADSSAAGAVPARVAAAIGAEPGADAAWAWVSVGDSLAAAVSGASLVIEAVPEDVALKARVWGEIGRLSAADALLASNTSAFSIDELAAEVPDPGRVLGMHWFNPAQIVPCVEVVTGTLTRADVVAAACDVLVDAGKRPVVVRNSPGFVANRIQFAMVREALLCLEEGIASADEIDEIVSMSFGLRLAAAGPLRSADLGGLDTYHSILTFLASELGERFTPPQLLTELVSCGRTGAKSGSGIREYDPAEVQQFTRERDATLERVVRLLQQQS